MGASELVTFNKPAGIAILQAAEKLKIPIDAAFWFLGDDDQWKLYMHTPIIDTKSRTKAYRELQKAVDISGANLRLGDITLLRGEDPLLKLMRIAISTGGQGIGNITFQANTVNGVFIRNAHIYRL